MVIWCVCWECSVCTSKCTWNNVWENVRFHFNIHIELVSSNAIASRWCPFKWMLRLRIHRNRISFPRTCNSITSAFTLHSHYCSTYLFATFVQETSNSAAGVNALNWNVCVSSRTGFRCRFHRIRTGARVQNARARLKLNTLYVWTGYSIMRKSSDMSDVSFIACAHCTRVAHCIGWAPIAMRRNNSCDGLEPRIKNRFHYIRTGSDHFPGSLVHRAGTEMTGWMSFVCSESMLHVVYILRCAA